MKEQIAPLLEKLAEKLGTTVEHLWQVLVRQAYIAGVYDISFAVIFILASVVGIPKFVRLLKNWLQKGGDAEFFAPVIAVASIVGWAVVAVIVLSSIRDAVFALANPEYWALKEVLEAIR